MCNLNSLPCNECMRGAPHWFCCMCECGEHEYCRGCNFKPNVKEKEK